MGESSRSGTKDLMNSLAGALKDLSGIKEFIQNAKNLLNAAAESYLREGLPRSNRSKTAVTVNNFFLHVQGAKTHLNTLRPTYTFGLGMISLFLFLITLVTGVLLTIYYQPSVALAYDSVKDINFAVSGGRLLRNVHKWAGEGMIIALLLHMARVFYTGSYKKGR